jgi:twitching motility protein PilT
VILVGEMRDLETISTALTAAETGHLVFGTCTRRAPRRRSTIIDVFAPEQQEQVRIRSRTRCRPSSRRLCSRPPTAGRSLR